MISSPKRMDVEQAREDLCRRTLSEIQRPLDRLIYLASMRDYNTGVYHHDGLASRFSEEVACEALADCHREAFRELVICPLDELVSQMEAYRSSTHTSPRDFLTAWGRLDLSSGRAGASGSAYPREFLFSNFKIALAVLESRLDSRPAGLAA